MFDLWHTFKNVSEIFENLNKITPCELWAPNEKNPQVINYVLEHFLSTEKSYLRSGLTRHLTTKMLKCYCPQQELLVTYTWPTPLPTSHIIIVNTRIIVFFTLFIFMLAAQLTAWLQMSRPSTFHISLFRQDMGEIESFQETIHDSTISEKNFCFGKLILQHWIQKMKV